MLASRESFVRSSAPVPLSAILLICLSVLCFSGVDSIVKVLSQRYPVPLLVWARWGVQMLVLLAWWGPRMKTGLLRTPKPGLQILRSVVLLCSTVCFFTALKYLPLAEATAINYSTPVIVILMAAFFLHERLTRTRVAFVLAGLAGMLLIVRPGTALFQGGALLALAAAGFYSTFQVLTRRLVYEDVRVNLFYPALVCTTVMTLALPFLIDWNISIPWPHIVAIVVAAIFGTLGHLLFLLAFQRAPISVLTPYTYLQLVFATLIGWFAFNDFPDAWTIAGMAVIAATGFLIALQERRRGLAAASKSAEPPAVD
jgi:drug/metabolite transporter (DMT)-like permease